MLTIGSPTLTHLINMCLMKYRQLQLKCPRRVNTAGFQHLLFHLVLHRLFMSKLGEDTLKSARHHYFPNYLDKLSDEIN